MMEFVSWDDDIPIYYRKIKNVPNHQPEMDMEDSLTIPDLQKGT
jgi:hypothetical protein